MKNFYALLRIKKKFPTRWHQDHKFRWRRFDSIMAVFLRQCHFQHLPLAHFCLKSHDDVPKIFHCLASPGKDCLLLLWKTKKEMHSLRTLQCYNPGGRGSYSKKFSHYRVPQSWLWIQKKQILKMALPQKNGSRINTPFIKIIDLGVILLEQELSTH